MNHRGKVLTISQRSSYQLSELIVPRLPRHEGEEELTFADLPLPPVNNTFWKQRGKHIVTRDEHKWYHANLSFESWQNVEGSKKSLMLLGRPSYSFN